MQGKDGTAHVTYYNKERALSFVWDDTEGHTVQVSWGGYAEPSLWTFELLDYMPVLGVNEFLRAFEDYCEWWIIQNDTMIREYVESL